MVTSHCYFSHSDILDFIVKDGFTFRFRFSACFAQTSAGLLILKQLMFFRFMEDLQAEVQEMEFLQFSKGMDTMRREDFAEWLLHYTNEEDNESYWENMRKKIPAGQVKTNAKTLWKRHSV